MVLGNDRLRPQKNFSPAAPATPRLPAGLRVKRARLKNQGFRSWTSRKPLPPVIAIRRRAPAAAGGTQIPRKTAPGAAAHDGLLLLPNAASRPGTAIRGRAVIVSMPAVRHPLPHITVHVVQTKTIRRKTPHRGGPFIVPLTAAAIAVGPVTANGIPPTYTSSSCPPAPHIPIAPRWAGGKPGSPLFYSASR